MKCSTPWCRNQRVKHRTICEKCKSRLYKKRHPIAYNYNLLRCNAKRRRKEFTLTLAQYEDFCNRTGYIEKKGQTPSSMSIDRSISSKGYCVDNIEMMTLSDNSKKGNKDICPF